MLAYTSVMSFLILKTICQVVVGEVRSEFLIGAQLVRWIHN